MSLIMLTFWKVPDSHLVPESQGVLRDDGDRPKGAGAMAKELPLDNVKMFEHKKCLEIDMDIVNLKIIYEFIVILNDDDSGQGNSL